MPAHQHFFQEIGRGWRGPRVDRAPLRVIGSAALLLQTDSERGTNDGDVLETASIGGDIQRILLASAGKGTRLHMRNGSYLDVVTSGLPFLPHGPR